MRLHRLVVELLRIGALKPRTNTEPSPDIDGGSLSARVAGIASPEVTGGAAAAAGGGAAAGGAAPPRAGPGGRGDAGGGAGASSA